MIKNKVLISSGSTNGNIIYLYSMDGILYDSDGETVIHDFSISPIKYNKTTGECRLNHGENSES